MLDVGERRVNDVQGHGAVDREIRRNVNVRWPVVAIDAVHPPLVGFGDFFRLRRIVLGGVDRHLAALVRQSNPGNVLPLVIRRVVLDLVSDIHVPMDATAGWTKTWVSTAYLDEHANGSRGVVLVRAEVREGLQLSAPKLPRPVTLFTSLLRRTKICHWRWKW